LEFGLTHPFLLFLLLQTTPTGDIMGGGGDHWEYPKYVWSPAGGWWNNPKNGGRNTIFAAMIATAVLIPLWMYSSAHEQRPIPPIRPIPSQGFKPVPSSSS